MKAIVTGIIGTLAAVIGTSLMLPQVIKSFRTKQVAGVSWLMLFLYFLNCALWLAYGILIVSIPLVVCNGIGSGIGLIQLCLHKHYSHSLK
jgi:MtN3 and saliva related transmembrane protein